MKNFRISTLSLGVLGLAVSVSLGYASSAHSLPSGLTMPPTASGDQPLPNSSGPIVFNWKIKAGDGKDKVINGVTYTTVTKPANVNLTVNSDGSWNYSGTFPAKADHDIDVVVGVKSHEGSVILFRYSGSMSNGVQFNKQGTSETIKDNFASFKPAHCYANYREPLSSEGIAKKYAERQERKEKLEAAIKAKDAKAKAEREKMHEREKREIAAEIARQEAMQQQVSQQVAQAQQQQAAAAKSSSSGGGSSVLSDVGSFLSTVGGVAGDIMSIF